MEKKLLFSITAAVLVTFKISENDLVPEIVVAKFDQYHENGMIAK